MSIDEFAENREFFNDNMPAGFDIDAFKKFVEQYGIEFAKGYFTAVGDFQPQIKNIFLKTRDKNREIFYRPTQHEMAKEGNALSDRMELLLHFVSAFLLEKRNDDANVHPPKSHSDEMKLS